MNRTVAARRPGRRGALLAGALLALAGWPADAAADGPVLGATIQGRVDGGTLWSTDAANQTTVTKLVDLSQKYQLFVDEQFAPLLRWSAQGLLNWNDAWTSAPLVSQIDSKRWNFYTRLDYGQRPLAGTLWYQYDSVSAWADSEGDRRYSPRAVQEALGIAGTLAPAELPRLDYRLEWDRLYDTAGVRDVSRLDGYAMLDYMIGGPVQRLNLNYVFRVTDSDDRVKNVNTLFVGNAINTTYSLNFWEDRGALGAYYNLSFTNTWIQAGATSGNVTVQQIPQVGLSLVEAFPSTPEKSTLIPNPALIDGNLNTPAGLNVGTGPALRGDTANRDMGAQFTDPATRVSQVWVYVDRSLPTGVAAGLQWAAYVSDDNVTWQPVPLGGFPQYVDLPPHFEIPIPPTASRYFKVVTRPLSPTVSADPRYADVFVTEIQFFVTVTAAEVRRSANTVGGNLGTTLRLRILREWNLTYDGSVNLNHGATSAFSASTSGFDIAAWSVSNALSVSEAFAPSLLFSARATVANGGVAGQSPNGTASLTANLTYQPFPELTAGLNYTGQVALTGVATSGNSINLSMRGDLYDGLSVQVSALAGITTAQPAGRVTRSTGGNFMLNTSPMSWMQLTATYSLIAGWSSGGGIPDSSDRTARTELGITVSPVPAFYLYGAVGYYTVTNGSSVYTNASVAFSPFPSGALVLRLLYTQYTDALPGIQDRVAGPVLNWTIRPGWLLTTGYTWTRNSTPSVLNQTSIWYASLLLTF